MSQTIVAVISSYNANPAFLKTQMDSILGQTIPVRLFVRDDGSTNQGTLDILREYERQGLIQVSFGENLGFERGFMEALRLAPPADYYAFCDQDDQWLPERAACAMELLEQLSSTNKDTPRLYCSRLLICDDHMEVVERQADQPYMGTFDNALTESAIPGMAMFLDAQLREQLIRVNAATIPGHDWLAYVVAAGLGKVVVGPRETVLKRRHADSVSAGGMTFFSLLKFRLQKFVLGDGLRKVRTMYAECDRLYGELLSSDDRFILRQFALPNSPRKAFHKLFWKRRYRSRMADEIAVRMMFVLGKL